MIPSQEISFRSQVAPLFFLVGIFSLNFLSRIVFSPLMPIIEEELKIGHREAGSLFFLVSFGYCFGLLFSGFISSWLSHRKTIIISSFIVGLTLLIMGLSSSLWAIRISLFIIGVGAGFYLPSGMATLTALVHPRHWGKAIAIHELAPNLGFIFAPLMVEFLLGWFTWQSVLILLGIGSVAMGILFHLKGKGGHFLGEAPRPKTLQTLFRESSFWLMVLFFSFGIGTSFGAYSMIPLYLVSERGTDRTWANTVLALSRVLTLGTSIVSGWVTDRLGVKKTLRAVFLTSGIATGLIGLIPEGRWIVILIFVQSILATSFFPAGFSALSQIGPGSIKNLTVSFTIPIGFLIGGGVIPAMIGFFGERGSFSSGFISLGLAVCFGSFLVHLLKFSKED